MWVRSFNFASFRETNRCHTKPGKCGLNPVIREEAKFGSTPSARVSLHRSAPLRCLSYMVYKGRLNAGGQIAKCLGAGVVPCAPRRKHTFSDFPSRKRRSYIS